MGLGSYHRRPQLTRSRGMVAAAALAAAIAIAYAVIGAVSLSAVSGTGNITQLAAEAKSWVGSVAFTPPAPHDLVSPTPGRRGVATRVGSTVRLDLGRLSGATTVADALRLTNTSSSSQTVRVTVIGAPGVRALFPASDSSSLLLASGQQASVALVTSPLHAGVISAVVQVALGSAGSYDLPLTADQAPVAPSGLTATTAAGGVIGLAWAASPSTGVGGYAVFRSGSATGPWVQVGAPTGTSFSDPTGTDGVTEFYRVEALAAGVTPALPSPPSAFASAVTDSLPPAAPTAIRVPVINNVNELAVPVVIGLPSSSSPADTVAVSLSDGVTTASGQTSGGPAQVTVPIDASALADGPIAVTVTLTDAVGNGARFTASTTKDTIAPAPPLAVALATTPANTVNAADQASVPVTVTLPAGSPDAVVHVQLAGGAADIAATTAASGDSVTLTLNASSLPDGPIAVTSWLTDSAGNASNVITGPAVVKDTVAPVAPASFTAAAGSSNPAGWINIASQRAAVFSAQFAAPAEAGSTISLTVAGQTFTFAGGKSSYTVGPLDLSGLPDGVVALTGSITDAAGNVTSFGGQATKDTVAPVAPTTLAVPAGPDNPAGFVNGETQTAATVEAQFAMPTEATDSLTLTVSGLSLGTRPGGAATVDWVGDLSSLADGTLQLDGTITDAAGNSTTFTATAIKDTSPPPAPAAAFVRSSPPNTILDRRARCVVVVVRFGAAVPAGAQATVTLTSGGISAATTFTVSGRYQHTACIDARALPNGVVTVTGTITDRAGNTVSFTGTSAIKRWHLHHRSG